MKAEHVTVPVLKFTHHGVDHTLVKHPVYVRAFKDGKMTLADFKFRPWVLRREINGRDRKFKLSCVDKDAIRAAKDILNGQRDKPAEFSAWLESRDAKRGIIIGALAAQWTAAGFPDHNGRVRDAQASGRMRNDLETALRWWSPIKITEAENHFANFITWRRANTDATRGTGDRAADLDLNALSCLCQWAVFAGHIDINPFRGRKYGGKRPTYHDKDAVEHCSDSMPESDEVVHRILTWFWTARPLPCVGQVSSLSPSELLERRKRFQLEEQQRFVAGGWLAWNNLTGLRAGEPFYLMRQSFATGGSPVEEPHRPDLQPPGAVFPFGEHKVMKVHREKNGQNPYVTLHSAATAFLAQWTVWLDTQFPKSGSATVPVAWFPNPADHSQPLCPLRLKKGHKEPDTTRINDFLSQACDELKLPHMTPSGFGRAYYTRVRKSQRASNAVIAEELGQTTLGKLIRTTYGRGDDMFGGHRYDWMPEDKDRKAAEPAWKLLESRIPANVLAIA